MKTWEQVCLCHGSVIPGQDPGIQYSGEAWITRSSRVMTKKVMHCLYHVIPEPDSGIHPGFFILGLVPPFHCGIGNPGIQVRLITCFHGFSLQFPSAFYHLKNEVSLQKDDRLFLDSKIF